MTDDEIRIAELEARVRAHPFPVSNHYKISFEDFETLLNSRLAWKFTAKCYAAETKPENQQRSMRARCEDSSEVF